MGYEANFYPPLEDKYKCPVCLCALKEPIQTKCGHRLCTACFKSIRGGNWYFRCPIDNTWSNHAFEDNAVQREVLSLNVKCNFEKCDWIGELRELQNHMKGCEYEKVKCPNKCNMDVMRIELKQHELECQNRIETCRHCGIQVIASQIARHQILLCPKFPVTCPTCGEVDVIRENMNSHINIINGDCPKITVPCSFRHIGCMHEDQRNKMAKHYSEANAQHLMLLSTRMVDLETKNRVDIQVVGAQFHQKLTQLSNGFVESENNAVVVQKELSEAKQTIEEMKSSISDLKQFIQRNNFMISHETHSPLQVYEWKIDFTSKRKAFFSSSYCLPTGGYKIHLWLKPEIVLDDTDQYATVSLVLEQCDQEEKNLPISFDCCFFLKSSTAEGKQLKSCVTTDQFNISGHVSKPMVLFKSNDLLSYIVDNTIKLEFTVRVIDEKM